MLPVYSRKPSKSMDLGAVLPFGLENLPIGFPAKNLISLWIKKSSTLERTKEKQDKYNEKRSKTLCVNFMFGALASFPQDAKRPFS